MDFSVNQTPVILERALIAYGSGGKEMNVLQTWLRQEVESGRLRARPPIQTWQVRFGPQTRRKSLWAYSTLHRWVWNYCNEYQAYQELPTDAASLERWFQGRGVALGAIRGYFEVYRARMRYWLLQGRRPYPSNGDLGPYCVSDSAHTQVARQMDEQGRRYILWATAQCAMAGAGLAAGGLRSDGYTEATASVPGIALTVDTVINGTSLD